MVYDISFFEEEIGLIRDDDLRGVVTEALERAPAWFWSEPASITGLHHPPDDLVQGGTCIHVEKVTWLAYRFFDAFNEDTDVGVAAALLHDIRRCGAGDEVGTIEDYKCHAQAGADYLRSFGQGELSYGAKCEDQWEKVCICIAWHMGKYDSDGRLPPSMQPQLLHLADVAASFRLLVGLPFYRDDLPALNDVMEGGKKFVERDGVWLINFGKFGKPPRKPVMEVMKNNPGYFRWMLKAGFDDEVCEQVRGFQREFGEMEKNRIRSEMGLLPFG